MAHQDLNGKVAVVTGAASGIGAASAHRLSREGCAVVLVDIAEEELQRVAEGLNGEHLTVVADVSQEEATQSYVTQAVTHFGRIDVAHLNAGIGGDSRPIVESSVENYDRLFSVNVRGMFLGLRAIARAMLAHAEGGAIATTGSLLGLRGGMNAASYAATKHAVVGLTRSAALEFIRFGIRVNAVCPGYVDTPLMRIEENRVGGDLALVRAAFEDAIPIGRYATPDEIASTVAWLLSADASYCTGGAFPVGGGLGVGEFASPARNHPS